MRFELHIGPYRGRDPHLWRASDGIVANGMELFESSKIPIATIADYLLAPETYDAEASWRRAIRDVAGDADLEAFALFADNVRISCLRRGRRAPRVAALQAFPFRRDQGDGERRPRPRAGALADRCWPPPRTCCAARSRTGP